MAKKQGHTGFRNGHLFCFNCGQSYNMNLPQPATMAAAMMKQFEKSHKNCAKTWEPPVADPSLTERERAAWWNTGMNGERGSSSEVMFETLYSRFPVFNLKAHPCDPDDFRRRHLLLETVPEWKERLSLLKSISPEWKKLVENWDTLTAMLLEQMAGKKNKMYEFMKELGC